MKKTAICFIFLIVIFALPVSASATAKAGIKPGSFFYFFDTTFEKINLFFTFNPENKARKALEYADERLAEVEAVASENKPKEIEKAMSDYEKKISLATEKSKELKDEKKTEELLNIVSENTVKHQETLAEVYNKVPDEAKKAIEKAIEASIKGREEALKEIQGLKKTVEDLQKNIESLKQQGRSDQSKEIEVLRKEVETLKSQQSSQSAKPQIIEKVVEKIMEVPPATPQKSTAKLSNSEIIEKVKPAVVYIQTSDGSGSGMIIESNGYVLTNAHVVSGFNAAKIKLSDGRLFVGSVIGRDEEVDLALLKINGDGFPIVELGNSDKSVLGQGDEVFSVGYSYGFDEDVSFKNGIISRRLTDDSGNTYLEITAEIQPGNSGGPLVNRFGQVVGINTFSFGKTGDPLKFAIPINLARGLIPELKSGRDVVLPKITLPSLPTPSPTPTPSPIPEPTPIPTPTPTPTPAIPSPLPPKFTSGPTPVLQKSESGTYTITGINWTSDKPSRIDWSPPRTDYKKCSPSVTSDFRPRTTYTCAITLTDVNTNVSAIESFSFTTGIGIFMVDGFSLASNSDSDAIDLKFFVANRDTIPVTLNKMIFSIDIQGGGGEKGNFTIGNSSKTKIYRYFENWQNTGEKELVFESDTSFDGSMLTVSPNIVVSSMTQKGEWYSVSITGLTGNPGPSDEAILKLASLQISEAIPIEFNPSKNVVFTPKRILYVETMPISGGFTYGENIKIHHVKISNKSSFPTSIQGEQFSIEKYNMYKDYSSLEITSLRLFAYRDFAFSVSYIPNYSVEAQIPLSQVGSSAFGMEFAYPLELQPFEDVYLELRANIANSKSLTGNALIIALSDIIRIGADLQGNPYFNKSTVISAQ